MTKRFSQANTVVVPAVRADGVDGKVAAAKPVVTPADVEVASVQADAKAGEDTVIEFVEPVAALVAPAPMAMVAEQTSTTESTTGTATAQDDSNAEGRDLTPYIVGGVLVVGGILAIALSSDDDAPVPPPPPPPPPAPVTTVAISSAATATTPENGTAGANGVVVLNVNAAATATNGGTPGAITYTLGGTDAALFTINSATGEIRLVNSANFEAKSTYNITVTASAAANGTTPAATATQNITVTITNVNEVPTFASATATATVVENTPAGVVYTATATDPDANTTLTYSLGGADAALFTINGATGAVSLRNSADFETKPSYTFTVVATDNGNPALSSTAQTVTLNVTNVNEAPTFTAATRTVSVPENTTAVLATGGATDQDASSTITYSLGAGGDSALFNVNATTGAVTFKAAPDFEAVPTKTTYTFNLVASDGTNNTTQAVTVNVTDVVNEGPPPATVSLDAAGPFSGLGAGGIAQATTFTDNTTVASNAVINNFGTDDIVRFSGTTAVSFSSIDNDLLIEFVNNGVLNKIQINDVVSPENFNITNEANAEAAVNAFLGSTGVDYFRFA